MSVNGDLIGDDALTTFAASVSLSTAQKDALRVLLRSIGYSVDIHAAAGTPGPQGPTGPTGATGPQGPAGVDAFVPSYFSAWTVSDSNAGTFHDVFDQDYYASASPFSSTPPSVNFTHSLPLGRISASNAGDYRVSGAVILAGVSGSVTVYVRVNGVNKWSGQIQIYTGGLGFSGAFDLIVPLAANDFVEVITSGISHTVKIGSSISISRVG